LEEGDLELGVRKLGQIPNTSCLLSAPVRRPSRSNGVTVAIKWGDRRDQMGRPSRSNGEIVVIEGVVAQTWGVKSTALCSGLETVAIKWVISKNDRLMGFIPLPNPGGEVR